jgi:phosphoribosylformimino-5-aminoimidazole carboxamide ribotide isomerase
MARSFENVGAKRLHLVDLDRAFHGKGVNLSSIHSILNNISIPVPLSGGLHNFENIEQMFDFGVAAVIVGTMAV